MDALIVCAECGAGKTERVRIGGVSFLQCTLPRVGLLARVRSRRCASRLRQSGITRAAFAEDFPYRAVFAAQGIIPPDPLPLRLAAADRIAELALRKAGIAPRTATAALAVPREDERALEACVRLAAPTRHLLLAAGEGGEALARRLRFACGAAAVLLPEPQQLAAADVYLCFDPKRSAAGALPLYDPAFPIRYAMPDGAPAVRSEELLSLLFAADAGCVRGLQIESIGDVLSLDNSAENHYNTVML